MSIYVCAETSSWEYNTQSIRINYSPFHHACHSSSRVFFSIESFSLFLRKTPVHPQNYKWKINIDFFSNILTTNGIIRIWALGISFFINISFIQSNFFLINKKINEDKWQKHFYHLVLFSDLAAYLHTQNSTYIIPPVHATKEKLFIYLPFNL